MAALLMGKALVAKNPKVQNNLWKQDVIKPFPSRFHKSSGLTARSFEGMSEVKVFAPSALNMFCNTSSTALFAAPVSTSLVRSFAFERNEDRPRRPRSENVNSDTFELDKLEILEVETSPKGNAFVPFNYNGAVLRMDTPSLRAPFGVKRFASSNGREEASINLGFDDSELSQKMLSVVKNIEQKLVQTAVEQAASWFPDWKDQSEAKIRAAFRSSLRPPRDPKFSPLWRLKLKSNARPTDFFYNGDRTSMDEVVPFSKITSVVELRGVWIMPDSFGTSWTALNCRIDEVGKPREKRFSDEPNETQ